MAATTPTLDVLMIFRNAYPGLEDQFAHGPTNVIRNGTNVALFFEVPRSDVYFAVEPDGDAVWCYGAEHPVIDEARLIGAIIDDQLDDKDYDLSESENFAMWITDPSGKVHYECGDPTLLGNFDWPVQNYLEDLQAKPRAKGRPTPQGANHVFFAMSNMPQAILDELESDFPVHEVRWAEGVTLVHFVTKEHDYAYQDKYDETPSLIWPELFSVLRTIAENAGEGSEAVWFDSDARGDVVSCDDNHAFFKLFGLRLRARTTLSVTYE